MSINLLQGDAVELIRDLDSEYDLILFDPPFWPKQGGYHQIRKNTKTSLKPIVVPGPEEYGFFWSELISSLVPHLKKSGWLIFKADDFHFGRSFEITMKYLDFNRNIIWDKGRIGLGTYVRPMHEILSCWFRYDRENVYFRKAPRKINQTLFGGISEERAKRRWHGGSRGIALESIIRIPNFNAGTIGARHPLHINETPVSLWMKIIPFFCPPNGRILDPFAGSGTIGMAVRRLNSREDYSLSYLGFEIDKEFFEIANARLYK